MTLKDKKELDKVLQIVMPDDYYEEMRKLLLPYLIKWHEGKVKNLSSNPVLADSTPLQECYKSGGPCKYGCSGLCKESC